MQYGPKCIVLKLSRPVVTKCHLGHYIGSQAECFVEYEDEVYHMNRGGERTVLEKDLGARIDGSTPEPFMSPDGKTRYEFVTFLNGAEGCAMYRHTCVERERRMHPCTRVMVVQYDRLYDTVHLPVPQPWRRPPPPPPPRTRVTAV